MCDCVNVVLPFKQTAYLGLMDKSRLLLWGMFDRMWFTALQFFFSFLIGELQSATSRSEEAFFPRYNTWEYRDAVLSTAGLYINKDHSKCRQRCWPQSRWCDVKVNISAAPLLTGSSVSVCWLLVLCCCVLGTNVFLYVALLSATLATSMAWR